MVDQMGMSVDRCGRCIDANGCCKTEETTRFGQIQRNFRLRSPRGRHRGNQSAIRKLCDDSSHERSI